MINPLTGFTSAPRILAIECKYRDSVEGLFLYALESHMARRRRSPRRSHGARGKPTQKKKVPVPVYIGMDPYGLDPPAHNCPLVASPELFPYPLMSLECDREEKADGTLPFVDPSYGYDHLNYREKPKLPPTWMDPEIFVKMCKADPRVKEVIARAYHRNNRAIGEQRLDPLLDDILTEEYLPYVLTNFSRVKKLISQWLIGNYARLTLDHEAAEKTAKHKRLAKERQGQ